MVELKDEDILSNMRARVQQQGDIVRALKSKNASDGELKMALSELKARKKLLEDKEIELMPPVASFDRGKLEDLLKQKFFYDQSFAIYGGIQGLYDFGPMGCAMKANLLSAWRQHFVLEDQLLEVDCSMLTPAPVLQASGHVDRFTDLMVKDVKTGECFRADHLVKAHLEAKQKHKKTTEIEKEEINKILIQLDNYKSDELNAIIRRYDMKSPGNNDLSEPQLFNLMFATMIGPTGQCQGYLRPETAQGIFVNFQRLLQFNQGRIPFGAAQIGSAFRNEISPRSGLIRVREFAMAEIEYFVDPKHKEHPKFHEVKNVSLNLYSACDQMDGRSPGLITIGEAVEKGIVANETLGYFMARIHLFLLLVGVDGTRLRFRQHLSNEMAHYACDCWDAECQTSYGWVECVGCADRSCYDLTQHTKATGTRLVAEKRLPEPQMVSVCECVPNKQTLGKAFRGDAKAVTERLAALTLDEATSIKQQLTSQGKADLAVADKHYTIDNSMVNVKEYENKVHVEEIVPNVIEPSFGIGRVLYAVFEHSFRIREGDEQRTYLSVPPILAPYKCSLLPLSNNPDFAPIIRRLSSALTRLSVTHRIDESSGSIGRRYARTDQIAIPYGITVDFDTINKSPATATLRERDSMKQIRVPLDELPSLINDLSTGFILWSEAQTKFPAFEQQETVPRDEAETFKLTETTIETKAPKNKKSKKNVKLADTNHPITSLSPQPMVDESAVMMDDWQSVSEELDDVEKKHDADADDWSSATETAETELESVPSKFVRTSTPTEVKNSHRNVIREQPKVSPPPKKGAEEIQWAANEPEKTGVMTEPVHEDVPNVDYTSSVSSGAQCGQKKPISWTDWGKAVRNYYKEEETREKQSEPKAVPVAETTPSLELREEARSSFSGYEADQEDNGASKSAAGHLSPSAKEHDTLYELSPAIQSLSEEPIKDKKSVELLNAEGEFPPLTVSNKPPNHGLFVGHGWPGQQKSADHKLIAPVTKANNSVSDTQPRKVTVPKPTAETTTTTSSLHSTSCEPWSTVMAQILDQSCESEGWQIQLDNSVPTLPRATDAAEVTTLKSDEQKNVQNKKINKSDVDHMNEQLPASEVPDNSHGLFSGYGWPVQSERKEKTSSKLADKKKQQTTEKPSKASLSLDDVDPKTDLSDLVSTNSESKMSTAESKGEKPNDWRGVIADMYEDTLPTDAWPSQLDYQFAGAFESEPQQPHSNTNLPEPKEMHGETIAPELQPPFNTVETAENQIDLNELCPSSYGRDIWQPAEMSKVSTSLEAEPAKEPTSLSYMLDNMQASDTQSPSIFGPMGEMNAALSENLKPETPPYQVELTHDLLMHADATLSPEGDELEHPLVQSMEPGNKPNLEEHAPALAMVSSVPSVDGASSPQDMRSPSSVTKTATEAHPVESATEQNQSVPTHTEETRSNTLNSSKRNKNRRRRSKKK